MTGTSYTITDLEPGVEYRVQIQARYYQGSHASNTWNGPVREATMRADGDPPTPTATPTATATLTPTPTATPTATPHRYAYGYAGQLLRAGDYQRTGDFQLFYWHSLAYMAASRSRTLRLPDKLGEVQ